MPASTSPLTPWLAAAGLLLVPAAILAENTAGRVWNERLFAPTYQDEVNLHTPQITDGTYLPPAITENTTYTIDDSPLILTGATMVPVGATLTLNSGVRVVAHEFAALTVEGTLAAAGTAEQPIVFTTNEVHPDNQTWGGIIVERTGQANLQHVLVEYASPALSCLPNSRVNAKSFHARFGLVGLYTESSRCTLRNSRLQAIQHGIVAVGVEPTISETSISSGQQAIRTTNYSLPTTN